MESTLWSEHSVTRKRKGHRCVCNNKHPSHQSDDFAAFTLGSQRTTNTCCTDESTATYTKRHHASLLLCTGRHGRKCVQLRIDEGNEADADPSPCHRGPEMKGKRRRGRDGRGRGAGREEERQEDEWGKGDTMLASLNFHNCTPGLAHRCIVKCPQTLTLNALFTFPAPLQWTRTHRLAPS